MECHPFQGSSQYGKGDAETLSSRSFIPGNNNNNSDVSIVSALFLLNITITFSNHLDQHCRIETFSMLKHSNLFRSATYQAVPRVKRIESYGVNSLPLKPWASFQKNLTSRMHKQCRDVEKEICFSLNGVKFTFGYWPKEEEEETWVKKPEIYKARSPPRAKHPKLSAQLSNHPSLSHGQTFEEMFYLTT